MIRLSKISTSSQVQHTFVRDLPYQIIQGARKSLNLTIAIIVLKQSIHGSDWEVAFLHTAFMAGFLASLFYMRWGNRYNPVKLIVWAQLLAQIAFLAIVFAFNSLIFTALVCFASFLNTLTIPILGLIYKRNYPTEIRGRIVGITKQWNLLATVLTAWGIGKLLEKEPLCFYWIYPLVALLGLATLFWFSTLHCPKVEVEQRSWRNTARILIEDKNFSRYMLIHFVFGFINIIGNVTFHLYINKKEFLGYTPEKAAIVIGVIPTLTMFLSVGLWGKIFDKMNIIAYRAITAIVMGLAFLFYALSESIWVIGIGSAIWGIGKAGGIMAWTLGVLAFCKDSQTSLYLGVHTFLTGLRGVIAPFVAVWWLEKMGANPTNYFIFAFVGIALCSFLFIAFVKVPENN